MTFDRGLAKKPFDLASMQEESPGAYRIVVVHVPVVVGVDVNPVKIDLSGFFETRMSIRQV